MENQATGKRPLLFLGIVAVGLAVALFIYVGRSWVANYYLNQAISAFRSQQENRSQTTKEYLRKSLRFDSNNPTAYFYLARAEYGEGVLQGSSEVWPNADWAKIVELLERAFQLKLEEENPQLAPVAISSLGRAYHEMGDFEKADGLFRKQIAQYPDRAFLARHILATDDFYRNNNPTEGLQVLGPALEAQDVNELQVWRVHILLARYYRYFGESELAKKHADTGIQTAPPEETNHEDVQTALLVLALEEAEDQNLTKALVLFEEAKKRAERAFGSSSFHNCNLARIYLFTGSNSRAITVAKDRLKEITTIDYPASICLETLVRSYLALRNNGEAKRYIEQYMSATEDLDLKTIYTNRTRKEFEEKLTGLR